MIKRIVYFFLLAFIFISCSSSPNAEEFKVFQINIWQEGTSVEKGFEGIIDEIAQHDADFVLLSEVRNYNETDFIARTIAALKERGIEYYGENEFSLDVGILSKYPILEQTITGRDIDPRAGVLKARIKKDEHEFVIYSAHLDYKNYACYLPRGYDGATWKKMDAPITHPDSVLETNRLALRDEAIRGVVADADKEPSNVITILGGDFNEPSHLDWTVETKDLYDHNGAVVAWDCSSILYQNGFVDAFRERYPSAVTHPGFTFPSDNEAVAVERLAWAPDSDERDRIDFIYYRPTAQLQLKDISIVGPSSDILYNQRKESTSQDVFIEPVGTWPTDHKALLATFGINK